jgi:hypothetical protein
LLLALLVVQVIGGADLALAKDDSNPAAQPDANGSKLVQTEASDDIDAMIHHLWAQYKDPCRVQFEKRMKSGDVYALYDIQITLNNLQEYAGNTKDDGILDEFARMYLLAMPALQKDKDGCRKWFFTSAETSVAKENPSLVGKEVKLCTVQFLYAVSSLLDLIASTPTARRSAAMKEFCDKFPSVVVRDHYLRWHAEDAARMQKQLEFVGGKKNFANAVGDQEMWVLAGAANILAANKADGNAIPLTAEEKITLLSFVELGTRLLKSRLTKSQLKNFQGDAVEGLNFDLGMWDGYPDYAYAGYVGDRYPGPEDKKPIVNVGWDISHARRFVQVFDTLYDKRGATGQTFPDAAVMKGLANQVAYCVFNRDFERPLFSNFMNGSNGWYRVGYASRKDFGYKPYGLSDSIPNGGYGFWRRFNPDMGKILMAFWQWSQKAHENNDPVFVTYYGKGYYPAANTSPGSLLMFLPTIAR